MEHHTGASPVDTHSTPALTTIRRLRVALPQNDSTSTAQTCDEPTAIISQHILVSRTFFCASRRSCTTGWTVELRSKTSLKTGNYGANPHKMLNACGSSADCVSLAQSRVTGAPVMSWLVGSSRSRSMEKSLRCRTRRPEPSDSLWVHDHTIDKDHGFQTATVCAWSDRHEFKRSQASQRHQRH